VGQRCTWSARSKCAWTWKSRNRRIQPSINRHPLSFLQPLLARTPSQRPISKTRKRQGEPEHETETISLHIPAQLLAAFTSGQPRFALLLAAPAFARELPRGKTPLACCSSLHQHHRSRSLARCHCRGRPHLRLRGRRLEACACRCALRCRNGYRGGKFPVVALSRQLNHTRPKGQARGGNKTINRVHRALSRPLTISGPSENSSSRHVHWRGHVQSSQQLVRGTVDVLVALLHGPLGHRHRPADSAISADGRKTPRSIRPDEIHSDCNPKGYPMSGLAASSRTTTRPAPLTSRSISTVSSVRTFPHQERGGRPHSRSSRRRLRVSRRRFD